MVQKNAEKKEHKSYANRYCRDLCWFFKHYSADFDYDDDEPHSMMFHENMPFVATTTNIQSEKKQP